MPPSGVAEQCQHASLDAAAPSFNPRFEQGNHMVSPGMLLLLSLPARGYYMHTSRSARCLSVPSPLAGEGQGGGCLLAHPPMPRSFLATASRNQIANFAHSSCDF